MHVSLVCVADVCQTKLQQLPADKLDIKQRRGETHKRSAADVQFVLFQIRSHAYARLSLADVQGDLDMWVRFC
jgi:hypothetical protein